MLPVMYSGNNSYWMKTKLTKQSLMDEFDGFSRLE